MANDHRFWDRMAKRYARAAVSDEAAYQEKLRKTRAVLGPDFRVLEIGCGTGSTAIALAPEVADYLATDISSEMLKIARGKAADIENLRFERARLDDVTPPDGGFDAILAHSILHLLPDKAAAIAQVFARLKPGGVFISSTTCMAKGGGLKPLLWAGNKLGLLPMVRFFSADALVDAAQAAGFDIEARWQPKPKAAVFLIARKPLSGARNSMNRLMAGNTTWALYSCFEESGAHLVHSDDLNQIRRFSPNGVVFKILSEDGEYTVIGAGCTRFRVRPEALRLIQPKESWVFEIGDTVTVKGRDYNGIIVGIGWHYKKEQPIYRLKVGGKVKGKRYWSSDLLRH